MQILIEFNLEICFDIDRQGAVFDIFGGIPKIFYFIFENPVKLNLSDKFEYFIIQTLDENIFGP